MMRQKTALAMALPQTITRISKIRFGGRGYLPVSHNTLIYWGEYAHVR